MAPARRFRAPAPVIAIVVLTYIVGALGIATGILIILLRYASSVNDLGGRTVVTVWGAIAIMIGLFTCAVASGLTRGRRGARLILTVALSISAAAGIVNAVLEQSAGWTTVVSIALILAALVVLWVGRSAKYFDDVTRAGG
jgi:uncharacterized membrane protein HdeD (DUF308 family)